MLYECETCFFRDEEMEEEFYEDSLSKDLFKKFELLTPPQSPPYDPFPPDSPPDTNLDRVSEKLLDPSSESTPIISLQDESSINLVSNLIQDCMWSGPCLAAAGLISSDNLKPKPAPSTSELTSTSASRESLSESSVASVGDIHSGQCVSPAAVFPYQTDTARKLENTLSYDLGSVIETPSPSESEDDEEEIDVVTVVAEKRARRRQTQSSQSTTIPSSLHSHLAAIHNYSNTTSSPPAPYSAPQSPQTARSRESGHSFMAQKRQRPMSMPPSPQPAKRQRSLLHSADLKRVVQKLTLGHRSSVVQFRAQTSRNSSDSEGDDTNKRAQHNVLERKRRNDLKSSFLRLRDHIPELSKQERTPKVTILKWSSDYIRSLTAQNKKLENELAKLKARHEHLRQRLAALEQTKS